MLDTLRKHSTGWVAMIFIGALVASFAIWGIGDIFRNNPNDSVAEVGDIGISALDFDREFRMAVQRLSNQTGGAIDSLRARQMGYDQQILGGMIQRTALDVKAKEMGLAISEQTLRTTIRNSEIFHSTPGNFSELVFQELLAQNNMTTLQYAEMLRGDLARQQLLDSLSLGVKAPRSMAEAIFTFQEEKRVADYLVIPPEKAGEIAEPTEEELAEFHKNNSARYTSPEYRSFSLLIIEPQDLTRLVEVDDAEIEERFKFDKASYQEPERRTIQSIPFLSEDEVKLAAAQLNEGATFEGLAETRGFPLEEITQTAVAEFDLPDAQVAKAAFALEKDVISEPINGQLGWALVRVTEITTPVQITDEEIKTKIREEIGLELGKDLLYEMIGQLDDELAAGATLEEAAAAIDMPVTTLPPVTLDGVNERGLRPTVLPNIQGLVPGVFQAEQGVENDLTDTPSGGVYVTRVDLIKEAALKPLEDVRDEVRTAFISNQRSEKLDEYTKDLIDRLEGGESFVEVASSLERSILATTDGLKRNQPNDVFGFEVLSELFTTEAGRYVYGPVGIGNSYIIAKVTSIGKPDAEDAKEQIDLIVEQLSIAMANDITEQYVRAVENDLNVRINQTVIENTLGPLPSN